MTAVTLVFQTVKSGFTLVYGIQNCDMISDAVFSCLLCQDLVVTGKVEENLGNLCFPECGRHNSYVPNGIV